MKYDAGWLISIFGLAVAMTSLWMVSRIRASWQREVADLRGSLDRCEKAGGIEVTQMRESLVALEAGMANAQGALREGRLNLSVRSQALQLLRGGASPEAVAGNLGMALSEARLLTRVSQMLSVDRESLAKG